MSRTSRLVVEYMTEEEESKMVDNYKAFTKSEVTHTTEAYINQIDHLMNQLRQKDEENKNMQISLDTAIKEKQKTHQELAEVKQHKEILLNFIGLNSRNMGIMFGKACELLNFFDPQRQQQQQ